MATTPYFHWPPHTSAGSGADSDVAGFGSGAPEMALATAAADTAMVSPNRAVAGRPRMRRSSSCSGKQQEKGSGAKKPPQRGLGVAELERLRCGGDPRRELAGVGGGDAGAQVHPLLHCNHHHLPASSFDVRYYSSLLVQPPPPASPRPVAPGCHVHQPAAAGFHRAPSLAPEQQYFMDRWGRMGPSLSPAGNGAGTGGDHQAQAQLLRPLAPEHPSSQNTIWRPAASSSSCLQSGHRCDLCARRTMRAFAERGAPRPPTPPTATTMPDYSIYDVAASMVPSRQGEAFVVRDRKRGALTDVAPRKKEVIREIEFFPAASTHQAGGGTGLDESEFVEPLPAAHGAGTCAAAPLDLSLRL